MSSKASATVTIVNRLGMHARPAMMLVDTASKFQSEIRVKKSANSEEFDGKSIMQVMMLAATQGTKIQITAEGKDADEAVRELVALVESGFSEE